MILNILVNYNVTKVKIKFGTLFYLQKKIIDFFFPVLLLFYGFMTKSRLNLLPMGLPVFN